MPECVACPVAPQSAMPPAGQQCPCRSCCCAGQPSVKPCYKQPKIPDSYAPRRCYVKPTAPVEKHTTYKMSFLPTDGCRNLREEVRKRPPNLVPSCAPMEGCTVQKLSYLPNPVCQTQPILPTHHDMFGQGPMQTVTTQRHDFVPKPCVLRESFKPAHKFHNVEQPFENRTINKMSYLAPDRTEIPKSFAPVRCYEKPAAKMDGTTVQKMSFLPVQLLPKEVLPWACKGQYQKPCSKLDTGTTYSMSYLDTKNDCRRQPVLPATPLNNPLTPSKGFDGNTVYKNSYLPATSPIPAPCRPVSCLTMSTAPMEGATVQQLSYLPNPLCATQPILPSHHDMMGQGPMQCVTTQRHDFVPKPVSLRESFKPPHKFHQVEQPFENRTVNRLSYLDPGKRQAVTSFKPINCYERATAKMEGETTQKLSYQPVCAPPPQRPPWACKGQYQKPCSRVEATTIYRASFLPPGEDCSEVMDPCKYGDCKPCPCLAPTECIADNPCACTFPRAECCG